MIGLTRFPLSLRTTIRHGKDFWGGVYKTCRGSWGITDIVSINSEDAICRTWRESAKVLLNAFFGEHRPIDVNYPVVFDINLPKEELSPEQVKYLGITIFERMIQWFIHARSAGHISHLTENYSFIWNIM